MMEKGDLYWVDFDDRGEGEPAYNRPALVVQADTFNRSAIPTVMLAPLTGTLELAKAPGNLLLRKEETGLKKDSVVVVSQIVAVNRNRLGGHITTLDPAVLLMIDNGIRLLFDV